MIKGLLTHWEILKSLQETLDEERNLDAWDSQIEKDAATGKLDALAAEALEEYHRGEATEL